MFVHARVFILERASPLTCHQLNRNESSPPTAPHDTQITSIYFLVCMASSAFSVVYLVILENLNGVQEEEYSQHDLLANLLFWCFLLAQSYVTLSCTLLGPYSLVCTEHLYLRCALQFGCFYVICSPLDKRRGPDISTSGAFVLFMALSFFSVSIACPQPVTVLTYMHLFLDFLMLFGHRWEQKPPAETLLNCRLFYVALTGTLLHIDVMVSSSLSQ